MTGCTVRWLYLLAGSALSAKEVREVCAWLANGSPDEVVALVMQLRRQELSTLLDVEEHASLDVEEHANSVASGSSRQAKSDNVSQDAVAEVARILRTESHLSVREAAERLAVELERELCLQSEPAPGIPTYSKESFQRYVGKLLKHTSPQILLHLAHRIRDSAINRPPLAWPLRNREDYADGK